MAASGELLRWSRKERSPTSGPSSPARGPGPRRQGEEFMQYMSRLPLLLFLVPLLAPSPAEAQFSVKGGMNLVDVFGTDVEASDPRPRLTGGLGFDMIGIGPLTLAPEIYYAQKGADDFQARLTAGDAAEISLAYVEVPVLVRLAIPLGGARFQPYLAGGPVFGWQLDCQITATETGTEEACDQLLGGQDRLEETLREFEQGLMFGAGFAFEVIRGIGAVTLDARYARGLTRLSDTDAGPEIRNRALSVLLGYRFGLGGGGPFP